MKRIFLTAAALSALLALGACHKKHDEDKRLGYILVGDRNGPLAPVGVKANKQNVLIELKIAYDLTYVGENK